MTLHMSDGFKIWPAYEDTVAALGEPQTGVPESCEFHWPDKSLGEGPAQ